MERVGIWKCCLHKSPLTFREKKERTQLLYHPHQKGVKKGGWGKGEEGGDNE